MDNGEPPVLLEWQPDPSVLSLIRGVSRMRAAGATAFILAALLCLWVATPDHVTATTSSVTTICVIALSVKFRRGVPRQAERADYDSRALAVLAHAMRIRQPSVWVIQRNGESVRVRGSKRRPSIVLTPKSLLVWRKDRVAHSVQLAHEMGHIWAGDLTRHMFLLTGVLLMSADLTLVAMRTGGSFLVLTLVAAGTAFISLRSFLRAREIAADFVAAQLLGPTARDALPDIDTTEGLLPRWLRTHPTPKERRRAFSDVSMLHTGLRLPIFAFGYSSAFALDMATAAYRVAADSNSRTAPLQVMLAPFAITVGLVFGQLLASGAILSPSAVRKSWFRAFLLGPVAYLLIERRLHVSIATVLICVIAVSVAAKIAVPLSDGIFLIVADGERLASLKHVLAQSLMPMVLWAGLFDSYFFHLYSPLAHLIGRLLPGSWV
jgi:Zn-dependent protease with chaperone function